MCQVVMKIQEVNEIRLFLLQLAEPFLFEHDSVEQLTIDGGDLASQHVWVPVEGGGGFDGLNLPLEIVKSAALHFGILNESP